MPCVKTKINISAEKDSVSAYQDKLLNLINVKLHKPIEFIMTVTEINQNISFGGNSDPAAYLELKSIGLTEQNALELSGYISELMASEFLIKKDRVYIEFVNAPGAYWGWNGKTFQSL